MNEGETCLGARGLLALSLALLALLGGAGAGDVAPSFKLCGDGDDDNAVVFICVMGFIGGSLMWTGMAGEGASRPPPAPAPTVRWT